MAFQIRSFKGKLVIRNSSLRKKLLGISLTKNLRRTIAPENSIISDILKTANCSGHYDSLSQKNIFTFNFSFSKEKGFLFGRLNFKVVEEGNCYRHCYNSS